MRKYHNLLKSAFHIIQRREGITINRKGKLEPVLLQNFDKMVRMFLVSANVGSVFESLDKGLGIWMNEFASVIRSKDPEFVGVHFQETGGKNYENGSNCIDTFFGRLVEEMRQLGFRRGLGFVDSRSDLEDQFTALSNVYFIHESVHPHVVDIWDFQAKRFEELPLLPKIYSGPELDDVFKKEKEKFPQHFYPNCKWSRKGFIKTRWRIGGNVLDFVNIHLFHDSDNVVAANSFPSEFADNRKQALSYTLQRLLNNSSGPFPLFIFGDFNFRLNTNGVVSHLRKALEENHSLSIGTKQFHIPDLERWFLHSYDWLKQFEFERQRLDDSLGEFELAFPPTYPFEEEESKPEQYMRTRCPAWCDRVLFTHPTKDIISKNFPVDYNVIGGKVCMGDHKPVYLSFTLGKCGCNNSKKCLHTHQTSLSPEPSKPFCDHRSPEELHLSEGLSPVAVTCPSTYGYRMTLTRSSKENSGDNGNGNDSPGCFATLFFMRSIKFPCRKRASDSVSINPPSSQVSDENESSSYSPQTSGSNTIVLRNSKNRRNDSNDRKFLRNLFRSKPQPRGLDKNNAKNIKENDEDLPRNNGIEIWSEDEKKIKEAINSDRIILPLILSPKEREILSGDIDIQEIYMPQKDQITSQKPFRKNQKTSKATAEKNSKKNCVIF